MKKQILSLLGDTFRLLAVLNFVWSVLYVGFYECFVVGIWRMAASINTWDTMKMAWAFAQIALCPITAFFGMVATRFVIEISDYFYRQSNEN